MTAPVSHSSTETVRSAESFPSFEIDVPMIVTTPQGVVQHVNRAFTITTGYTAQDVCGTGAGALNSRLNPPGLPRAIRKGVLETGHWSGGVWTRLKSGDDRFGHLTIHAGRDESGATTHVVGLLTVLSDDARDGRNIQDTAASERQPATAATARAPAPAPAPADGAYLEDELFDLMARDPATARFFQNAALDGVWYWDLENPEYEWMSDSFWRLFGIDPATRRHLSAEWQDLIDPDDLATALSNFERHAADPAHPYDQIVRYRHADGSTVWVRCRGMAIRDDTGRPVRLLGAHTDVTALMRARQMSGPSAPGLADVHEQVLKSVSEAVFGLDRNGLISFANPAACTLFGRTEDRLIGQDGHALLHPHDADNHDYPRDICPIQNAVRTGTAWQGQEWVVPAEGAGLYAFVSVAPLTEGGQPAGAVVAVSDLTEQKASEATVRREKERLHSILEGTQAGTWEWNIQTGEAVFNDRWAEIIGETLDSLAPVSIDTWLSRVHPDDAVVSQRLLEQHFRGESGQYDCEARMRHRDGHWVWVLDRGRVLEWTRDGRPLRMAGTHIDITERARDRAALAEREQLYRLAQTATGVGIWDWDVEKDRVTWDAACWTMLGYDAPAFDLTLQVCQDLMHPDDREPLTTALQEQLEQGGAFCVELRFRGRSGDYIWVQGRGQVIDRDDDGRPLRMIGSHTPIQDAKEAQLEIQALADRLCLLARHVPGFLYQYRLYPDGRSCFPYASLGIQTIYGCHSEDVTEDAAPVFAVLHPDDVDRVGQEIRASADTLDIWSSEYRVNHPEKGEIWVSGKASPQRLPDNSVLWHGYITDVTERRRLEQAALEQHRLYRSMFETISDAVVLIDVDANGCFRYRAGNDALLRQTGLTDLPGKTPHDLLPADIADTVSAEYRRCLETRAPHTFETIFLLPRGRQVWETKLTPILDNKGDVSLIAGIGRDVTTAREAHDNLKAREQSMTLLFDAIPDPVLLIDPANGKARRFNSAAPAQLGYTAEEFAKLEIGDYEVLESAEETAAHVAQVLQHGAEDFDTRHRHKDGHILDVRVSACPVETEDGLALLCVYTDISESKRLQTEVTATRDQLASYFAMAPVGIMVTDAVGRCLTMNPAVTKQCGGIRDDLTGTLLADIVWPDDRAEAEAYLATVLRNGEGTRELRFSRRSGGFFWASVRAGRLADGNIIAFVEDITEEKLLRDELHRSNSELEQFAYVASHDLRTPLRMITSFAQLIERDQTSTLSEKSKGFLTHVCQGGQRMDEMLLALLRYSRVGRQGDPLALLPARELLDEALDYLDPVIHERKAVIATTGQWPFVFVSRNEGVRLFQNLISNALKYCPPERVPKISVSVEQGPDGWEFAITDNGIGITPTQLPRLFKVFQRLHTREEYEGTGIGLATCRRIVERHGGRIQIESEGIGRGTTVRFNLPAHTDDKAAP